MPPIPSFPIKIVILDDYQDIASSHFSSLEHQLEVVGFKDTLLPYNHPSTPEDVKTKTVERLKPFNIISSMRERTPFPSALLSQLPNLKLLLTTGSRNAAIDMEACKRLGIRVTGTTGYERTTQTSPEKKRKGPDSTTQHTVALILGLARNLADDHQNMKEGRWQSVLATGLTGKNFASLGLGRLGGNVAKIMHESFGMRIICWSNSLTQDGADKKARALGLQAEDEDGEKTFKVVTKEELFVQADVLSVHYVLSDRSRGIVDSEDLAKMKKSALLINTSRGPLVDDAALFNTLEKGAIHGAALDVFEIEPLPKDSRWRSTEWGTHGRSRVLLSPHMGYVEQDTMRIWYVEQAEVVKSWLNGEPLPNVLA